MTSPDSPQSAESSQATSRKGRLQFWRRPTPSAEQLQDRRIRNWAELWETIIITLATVATIWAGYQAGEWNNAQLVHSNRGTILRIEASQSSARGFQARAIDVGLFTEWIDAYATGNTRVADFFRARFRDEFRPAFDAWLTADPFAQTDAPDSPFDMPAYRVASLEQADALLEEAEQAGRESELAGGIADQYTLAVVVLAASLLLAGVANRFEWAELRAVVVAAALIVLLYSVITIIRLPVY